MYITAFLVLLYRLYNLAFWLQFLISLLTYLLIIMSVLLAVE